MSLKPGVRAELENRLRDAYTAGYDDGFRVGKQTAIDEMLKVRRADSIARGDADDLEKKLPTAAERA